MTKKQLELKNQIEQLRAEARQLTDEGKVAEAKVKVEEMKNLKEQLELSLELDGAEDNAGTELGKGEKKDKEEETALYKSAFLKAFRGKKLTSEETNRLATGFQDALSTKTDADGGYLIPDDIQTRINQYKRTLPELERLIEVVPTSLVAGTRVFEKLATMTPLENITDETADIGEMASPQFEQVSYAIKDYAGWMPIPNNLLNDSDQNIQSFLVNWIGRKSVVTRNYLILTLLGTLTKTAFTDWKAMKKALNVTLDPMISANASVVTNQDGLQYLDTLVDTNGRPLLKDDLTQSGAKLFSGKPIIVVANNTLATTGTTTKKAPCIIGDLREIVKMFERQGHLIASTNVGGTAFRKNRTEIRVIEREDVVKFDPDAVVYGEIDVTALI